MLVLSIHVNQKIWNNNRNCCYAAGSINGACDIFVFLTVNAACRVSALPNTQQLYLLCPINGFHIASRKFPTRHTSGWWMLWFIIFLMHPSRHETCYYYTHWQNDLYIAVINHIKKAINQSNSLHNKQTIVVIIHQIKSK